MTPPTCFSTAFWLVALLASGFYGWKAFDAFEVDVEKRKPVKKYWAWWVHQAWFNFLGSLVGWTATWVLVQDAWPCLAERCVADVSWQNAILASTAFVGVTGHLPFATFGLLQGLKELALKATGQGS